MTEIEKAIDKLLDLSECTAFSSNHMEADRESFLLAVSALREKQARETECGFYNEEYAVMSGSRMTQNGTHKGCTAKFCHMCEHKLRVMNMTVGQVLKPCPFCAMRGRKLKARGE